MFWVVRHSSYFISFLEVKKLFTEISQKKKQCIWIQSHHEIDVFTSWLPVLYLLWQVFDLVFCFHQMNSCYDNKRDYVLVFCTFAFIKAKHFINVPFVPFIFFQLISPGILESDITSRVAAFCFCEIKPKMSKLMHCNNCESSFDVENYLSSWFSSFHIFKWHVFLDGISSYLHMLKLWKLQPKITQY